MALGLRVPDDGDPSTPIPVFRANHYNTVRSQGSRNIAVCVAVPAEAVGEYDCGPPAVRRVRWLQRCILIHRHICVIKMTGQEAAMKWLDYLQKKISQVKGGGIYESTEAIIGLRPRNCVYAATWRRCGAGSHVIGGPLESGVAG